MMIAGCRSTSAWRMLLVAGHLAGCSALTLRDGAEAKWVKSDIAVLIPVAHCSQEGFWEAMTTCVSNVAAGAKEWGKTLAVHVATGQECSVDQKSFPLPGGVHNSIVSVPANSSGELLSWQMAKGTSAGAQHELVLVIGLDSEVEVQHRAVESLCGTAPQVVSVLRKFSEDSSMKLLAPLGTMMTAKTKTADIMPALRRVRFGEDETCERAVSKEHMSRLGLEAVAPAGEVSVAVAGGMYWARHRALRERVPEFNKGLRVALGMEGGDARAAQRTVLETWIPTLVGPSGGALAEIPPAPKPLALYFPQYHPIPENDRFWGKGFTDWTLLRPFNEERIRKPLSVERGGLGYYDLRDREVRRRQGQLARDHGIHGFVYYHYWFSSVVGHKVMYKVPELRIADGEPSVPFMFSWANEAWSRQWDGGTEDAQRSTMLRQEYGGEEEWTEHFNYLLQFFKHPKYIRVEGKPAFAIYRPGQLEEKLEPMLAVWNRLAVENGLPGLHIIATVNTFYKKPEETPWHSTPLLNAAFHFLAANRCCWQPGHEPPAPPGKRPASTNSEDDDQIVQKVQYWGASAGFDNRARRHGFMFVDRILSPPDFGFAVASSLEGMARNPQRDISDNLYFLASWNEWNEQSFLEPDDTYGSGFLEALGDQLRKVPVRVFVPP